MVKKRIEEVDLLRGIAIILMILGHAIITYPVDVSKLPWCVNLHNIVYSFHMELLFFVGGVVYKCISYKDFAIKKFKRIAIPYIFFGLVNMLLHTTGSKAINTAKVVTLQDGLYKFFFAGGAYWFLYTMLVMFLIYPLIEKVVDTTVKKLGLVVVMILAQCIIQFPGVLTLGNVVYYFPYFIAGQLVKEHYLNSNIECRFKSNAGRQIAVFLSCVIAFAVLMHFVPIDHTATMLFPLQYAKASLLIIATYVLALWLKGRVLKYILTESSIFSLQLYLFNGFILTVVRIAICNLCGITNSVVIVFGIWMLDIAITFIACRIIKKFKVGRVLCGL